jgi:hypothetical protein
LGSGLRRFLACPGGNGKFAIFSTSFFSFLIGISADNNERTPDPGRMTVEALCEKYESPMRDISERGLCVR